MRVEVVESLSETDGSPELFSDAAVERAQRNFATALESDDSLFVAESSGVALTSDAGNAEKVCRGAIALRFREESHAESRRLYFSLIEKLAELLRGAGSTETLAARLCLVPGSGKESKAGFVLRIRLEAKGSSAEQAGLRWGLGLAPIPQALVFLSVYLRQQT